MRLSDLKVGDTYTPPFLNKKMIADKWDGIQYMLQTTKKPEGFNRKGFRNLYQDYAEDGFYVKRFFNELTRTEMIWLNAWFQEELFDIENYGEPMTNFYLWVAKAQSEFLKSEAVKNFR